MPKFNPTATVTTLAFPENNTQAKKCVKLDIQKTPFNISFYPMRAWGKTPTVFIN